MLNAAEGVPYKMHARCVQHTIRARPDMTDDSPMEFRAAKPGRSVADWLALRVRRDATVYAGAAALLMLCGVFALFATYIFAFLVMMGLNLATCGVSRALLHLPTIAAVAVLFLLQRKVDGDDAEPIVVDAGARGTVQLRLSRLTGNSWLMYLDNPSGELDPVSRFATNVVLIAPRLLRLGMRMWQLSRQMKAMDVASVAGGLDALMQSGGRIAIGDLLQEYPSHDPQRLIGDLTTVDGVILLASEPPGLTLTPSVAEEFEAWKREARRKRKREH